MQHICSFCFCLLIGCLSFLPLHGQVGAGIKLGWEFENNVKLNNPIKLGDSIVLMNIKPRNEGHLGLWINGVHKYWLFQMELLFFQTQERYLINFPNQPLYTRTIRDKRLFLELPILLGRDYGGVNFYGGIAPRLSLNKPDNLGEWFSLQRNQTDFNLKYTVGFGLKIESFIIDFRYHNSLIPYVETIMINEIPLETVDHIERFSISVSINLLRE